MLKRDKERIVAELAERFRAAQTLIVTDYRGLSVSEIDELRTKLLEQGVRYTVVKNTLTKLAAEQAGARELSELVDGPTAIAFLDPDADPAAAAKVLNEAASVGRVLVIRGGILDGKPITEGDVKSLASLPPADVLRGQLAGALTGPLTMVVGLFNAPLRDFVGIIDARIRQLEEHGEAIPAAAEAEATTSEAEAAEEPAGEVRREGAAEDQADVTQVAEPEAETPSSETESKEQTEAEEEEQ
jgi:large subunit ribosomal protein L10